MTDPDAPQSAHAGWRGYESAVAAEFQQLGFRVALQERVTGARGKHVVDVTARAERANVDQLWIVECKLWKTAVSKSSVLTLQSIVEDVGADRGFLFSESGFQVGAVHAVDRTNITLTSIEDFKEQTASERQFVLVRTLERLRDLAVRRGDNVWILPGGHEQIPTMGRLSFIQSVLRDVRRGSSEYYVIDAASDTPTIAEDWEAFFASVTDLLDRTERFLATVVKPDGPAAP